MFQSLKLFFFRGPQIKLIYKATKHVLYMYVQNMIHTIIIFAGRHDFQVSLIMSLIM